MGLFCFGEIARFESVIKLLEFGLAALSILNCEFVRKHAVLDVGAFVFWFLAVCSADVEVSETFGSFCFYISPCGDIGTITVYASFVVAHESTKASIALAFLFGFDFDSVVE